MTDTTNHADLVKRLRDHAAHQVGDAFRTCRQAADALESYSAIRSHELRGPVPERDSIGEWQLNGVCLRTLRNACSEPEPFTPSNAFIVDALLSLETLADAIESMAAELARCERRLADATGHIERTEDELARVRAERDDAAMIVREYARANPRHYWNDAWQDPCGAHAWLERFDAAPPPPEHPAPPVEMSPEFTDTARAALLWVLWHHQGGSSPVGQPLRFALGMGAHDRLNAHQVAEAKRWGELTKSTTAEFHAHPAPPSADARDAARLDWIERHLFERKWNGVIDSGSRFDWSIRGDYRHTTQAMQGETFSAAIDAAAGKGEAS